MRDEFAKFMTEIAGKRDDVCLLSGDIGNRMFDKYKSIAPERFFNCGIAESNMMSVAAGMALCGMKPVVYTITPFTTTRCLEQIKIGVAYHNMPVIIVGTGSGLSYAELGPTHHSLEDMGILRSIPDLQIMAPADRIELREQLEIAMNSTGPTYIRIGKKGEPDLNSADDSSRTGLGRILEYGDEIALLAVGPIVSEGLKAAKMLRKDGIKMTVASLGGIRPFDIRLIDKIVAEHKVIVTLEEHGRFGGLGSTVAEMLVDKDLRDIRLERIDCGEGFIHYLGKQGDTRIKIGIDSAGIHKTVMKALGQSMKSQ